MSTGYDKEQVWNNAKDQYKIQQIREEWEWLIGKVFGGEQPLKNILEIGCYDGGSSYYLSKHAKNMITIDNNDPCRFDYSIFPCDYKYVAGDSHHPDQIKQFEKYNWDFAFIDGDHSYEGVKADFYNLLPYLKKGTPVAFHDIVISDFHHTHGCYVGEFWRDLKNEYKATKFEEFSTNLEWAGIGIVWV
jgi:predicted O-methyltransferase YrrM